MSLLLLCPVCFGAADTGIVDAARWGAWALIGLLLLVQGGFVAFFLHLRRQARRAAEETETEWSRYQRRRAERLLEAP